MSKTDIAQLRENIISKYSSSESLDEEKLKSALIGIEDTKIFDLTFLDLYDKFTPRATVYMNLCKTYTPTQAKAIMKVVDTSMSNPLDLQREINYNLHQVDSHITTLRDIIQKANDGVEGYLDIDVSSLYPELRQWLTFRANIIGNIQTNLLTDKKLDIESKKVDKMNKPVGATPIKPTEQNPEIAEEIPNVEDLSTEELEKLLKESEGK